MKKIPLNMITSLSSYNPYSPVYWDGYNIVISNDSDLNLETIKSKIFEHENYILSTNILNNDTTQRINVLEPQVSLIKGLLDNLLPTVQAIVSDVDSAYSRLPTLEERVANNEEDINTLTQSYNSISSNVNTLEALENGTFFAGSNGISIERITSAESVSAQYRISYIGQTRPNTYSLSSNSSIIEIAVDTSDNYILDFNVHQLHERFEDFGGIVSEVNSNGNIVIKTTGDMIVGTGGISVEYDETSGIYTISNGSVVDPNNTYPYSAVEVDNITVRLSTTNKIELMFNAVNSKIYDFSYVSSNYESSNATTLTSFIEEDEPSNNVASNPIYNRLPADALGTSAKVSTSNYISYRCKSKVFSGNSGKYMIFSNGVNSQLKSQAYTLSTFAKKRNLSISLTLNLLIESLSSSTLTDLNFTGITPFFIVWLHNSTEGSTSFHYGDILPTCSRSLDNKIANFEFNKKFIINNSNLDVYNLHEGSLEARAMIGFKLENSDAVTNFSELIGDYLIAPKYNLTLNYA